MTKTRQLLYQEKPKYDLSLKVLVAGVLALTLIPGIALVYSYPEPAWTLFGLTVFDGLLMAAVIPRKYQLFEDRLRIQLGGPIAINVPYRNIKEVRPATGSEAYVYWGLRLATSKATVVEIIKTRGLSMVISPVDRDIFMEQLEQARRQQSGNAI